MVRDEPIDGVLGAGAATEVPGYLDGAAHVLLVNPAVEHADVQEVGHRARARRRRHRLGEVLVVAVAQRVEPQLDQLVPFGEHGSAPGWPRRASTSASLNWPIGFFT